MSKEELYDKIDQYLSQSMSEGERSTFEQAIANDEALAAEVALHRRIQQELAKEEKQALRDKLRNIVAEPLPDQVKEPKNKPWLWMLFSIICLAIAFLLWYAQSIKPTVQDHPSETEIESPPIAIKDSVATTITPPLDDSIPKTPVEQPSRPRDTPPPSKPEPIASLDPAQFTVNPYLEDLVGNQVRSEATSVSAQLIGTDLVFSPSKGQTTIHIEGQIETTAAEAELNYLLHIYSNREADYINDVILKNYPLQLAKESPGVFSFQLRQAENLTAGLYYFIIVDAIEEEPLFTGKFEVR